MPTRITGLGALHKNVGKLIEICGMVQKLETKLDCNYTFNKKKCL